MWTWVKAAPRSLCGSTFELSVPWCSRKYTSAERLPPRWWSVDAALWRSRAACQSDASLAPSQVFTWTTFTQWCCPLIMEFLFSSDTPPRFQVYSRTCTALAFYFFFSIKIYLKFLSRDSRLRLVCLFTPLVCRHAEDWIKIQAEKMF